MCNVMNPNEPGSVFPIVDGYHSPSDTVWIDERYSIPFRDRAQRIKVASKSSSGQK